MKKIVFGLVAVAVLVSACAKNVVPSTEQLRADDQQVIDEQPADEGIPFRAVVSHGDIKVKAVADAGTTITTSWAETEEIALIYSVSGTPTKTVATISDVDGSGNATISATLNSGVANGADVTLIYPASAADGTTGNILASVISTQDGTLSVGRDIRKGTGKITNDGVSASLAAGASVPAQYAILKLDIKDVDASNSLDVSSLVIKDDSNIIATVTPGSATNTLYVTLPATSGTLWFEGVVSGHKYVAKGSAALSAGYFYRPTVKLATVFNVIGADGKFYKDKAGAVAASTTAAAIIAYVGDDTAEDGFAHGLALSMKNALNGSLSTMRWKDSGSGVDNPAQYSAPDYAYAAKESGRALSITKNNSNYPAFQAAISNSFTVESGLSTAAPSGTSGWFMASLFQWNQIIKSISRSDLNLSSTVPQNALKRDAYNSDLAAAGVSYSALLETYYDTSTESDKDYNWRYEPNAGKVSVNYKSSYHAVRSVLAF